MIAEQPFLIERIPMNKIVEALLCVGAPMCLAYFAYRLFDRKGNKTEKIVGKLTFLKRHKFIAQIGGMVGFVLLFGIISMILGIPKVVFYVVSGIVVGLINGFSATLMYNE